MVHNEWHVDAETNVQGPRNDDHSYAVLSGSSPFPLMSASLSKRYKYICHFEGTFMRYIFMFFRFVTFSHSYRLGIPVSYVICVFNVF